MLEARGGCLSLAEKVPGGRFSVRSNRTAGSVRSFVAGFENRRGLFFDCFTGNSHQLTVLVFEQIARKGQPMKTIRHSGEWPIFKVIAFIGANALVLEAARAVINAVT